MEPLTLYAPAKVNLTLTVGDRRPDGYHNVSTVMQAVSLYDTLTLTHGGAGLTLTCQSSAPLYVLSADKVSLTLAPDTVNTFTDGKAYTAAFEKQPNACICSRDDLVINGTGTLNVQGNFNNGIGTKNDLRIAGGVITVSAVKNALKGNDSVAIQNGAITLTAGKDAIKADNEDKPDKGYVYIAGGDIRITAGDDAIQATQDVTITGGALTVTATGKAVNSKGSQDIASGVINGK